LDQIGVDQVIVFAVQGHDFLIEEPASWVAEIRYKLAEPPNAVNGKRV
jgi:hypothetical protein